MRYTHNNGYFVLLPQALDEGAIYRSVAKVRSTNDSSSHIQFSGVLGRCRQRAISPSRSLRHQGDCRLRRTAQSTVRSVSFRVDLLTYCSYVLAHAPLPRTFNIYYINLNTALLPHAEGAQPLTTVFNDSIPWNCTYFYEAKLSPNGDYLLVQCSGHGAF